MKPLILFDGICNFCNSSVNFVIRHDRKDEFMFASLQSPTGMALKKQYLLRGDSFVLVTNGIVYQRSTAALKVLRMMGFPWNIGYGLMIVPEPWRDALYSWVAKNRYEWFGKKDTCMIPDQHVRAKFIDI